MILLSVCLCSHCFRVSNCWLTLIQQCFCFLLRCTHVHVPMYLRACRCVLSVLPDSDQPRGHCCPSTVPSETGQGAHTALGTWLSGWPQTSVLWCSEMGLELWGSPVLSYSLKHAQRCGISAGRFITTLRPHMAQVKLVVVPCSFAISSYFAMKMFPNLGMSSLSLYRYLFDSPAALDSPQH